MALHRSSACFRRLVAVVVATSVHGVALPMPIFAQDRAALDKARSDFQRALELKSARDFGGALKLLREVGQVKMTPQVRYHIATCEEGLGQLVAALGGYELALSQSDGMPPAFIAEVEAAVEKLRARIPKLVIERGDGAEAATIQLDEVSLGVASIGAEIPLDPGPHTVTSTAPGREKFSRTVTLVESATERLVVELPELPAESLAPRDEAEKAPEKAEPEGYGILPYVLGGVGVVGIATGVILLPVSQGKAGEVSELCGGVDCTHLREDEWNRARGWASDASTLEAIGWITIGVGAAALGTGAVLYFLDPTRRVETDPATADTARFRLVPSAPRSEAGLSVFGSF